MDFKVFWCGHSGGLLRGYKLVWSAFGGGRLVSEGMAGTPGLFKKKKKMKGAVDNLFPSNTRFKYRHLWLWQLLDLPDVILALQLIWLVEPTEELAPSQQYQLAVEVRAS